METSSPHLPIRPLRRILGMTMILCSLSGSHLYISLTDMHFLCFNFTVEASSRPGKPWLRVQCSMDGTPLLEYDNVNKAKVLGSLGKEINSTKAWADLTQTLEEMGQEFRKRLLHIKMRPVKTTGKYRMGCRGQDSRQERGREDHMWEGHFRYICVKELNVNLTLETHVTSWVVKGK